MIVKGVTRYIFQLAESRKTGDEAVLVNDCLEEPKASKTRFCEFSGLVSFLRQVNSGTIGQDFGGRTAYNVLRVNSRKKLVGNPVIGKASVANVGNSKKAGYIIIHHNTIIPERVKPYVRKCTEF